jgi:1-deoxy-D-xylulose 5-phosphate reductoisomerase
MADQPIRRIAIFGSTGSVGTQALEVIKANPDKFSAEVLTAHGNEELLIEQSLKYNPNIVVIVRRMLLLLFFDDEVRERSTAPSRLSPVPPEKCG